MSGPKSSSYTLSSHMRQQLLARMHNDHEIRVKIRMLDHDVQLCEELNKKLENSLHVLSGLQELRGGYEDLSKMATDSKNELLNSFVKIRKTQSITVPDYMTSTIPEQERVLRQVQTSLNLTQKIKRDAESIVSKIENAGKTAQRDAQQQIVECLMSEPDIPVETNYSQLEKSTTEISEIIGGVYSFDAFESDSQNREFDNSKVALNSYLLGLLNDDLSKEIVDEIHKAIDRLKAITQESALRTFKSITLKKIESDIKLYHENVLFEKRRFDDLLQRYYVLCERGGITVNEPRAFENYESLEKTVKEIEEIVSKQIEQRYIADCVDEVMQDMGYDLIGKRDVRKKSGKYFRNELFNFSDGTAVNVTYSPEGNISMEIAGLSHEDRVPSSEETSALTREMESFCSAFSEFEKRLVEKGVIVGSRIALLPPKPEYATILNLNDYELESKIEVSEINAEKKRKKEVKMYRREE